jgi:hypothetical protein
MDEQWGYVGAKSRQRWLFYAYDRSEDGGTVAKLAMRSSLFCLIQRPYISKTLLTRRISPQVTTIIKC